MDRRRLRRSGNPQTPADPTNVTDLQERVLAAKKRIRAEGLPRRPALGHERGEALKACDERLRALAVLVQMREQVEPEVEGHDRVGEVA